MFETMLNQPSQVDVEENLSTVEQRLDEPTIEELERAVDMKKMERHQGKTQLLQNC